MRILITGGGGQLGQALVRAFRPGEATALSHAQLDVTDRAAVAEAMRDFRPEAVIHTAAWTDTAACERDPERAMRVNATGAGIVAEAARSCGAAMFHISTNEVFDGAAGEPYSEGARPNPINEYGRSKLEGERLVAAASGDYAIIRTSWLYGPGRVSFPEKVLQLAAGRNPLRMVTDEVASPTSTVDLAQAIVRLVQAGGRGIFHLTNAGSCSRLEWARAVLDLADGQDIPVDPVTQEEFGAPYRKPPFSALQNARARALGVTMRPWTDALAEYIDASVATLGKRKASSNR